MPLEKRKERRMRVRVPVELTLGGSSVVGGEIVNISRLGAFVEVERTIDMGSIVTLAFALPDSKDKSQGVWQITCTGEVFRSHFLRQSHGGSGCGVGIFFTGFSRSEDKIRLSSYIDYLIEDEDKRIEESRAMWKNKRQTLRARKRGGSRKQTKDDLQTEIRDLLYQIILQLDELSGSLKPKK
jgi:hypothetical protein